MPKRKKTETTTPASTTDATAATLSPASSDATTTEPGPVAPETAPPAPTPAEDLVQDDGEMVTREERDGRQKIRREIADSKAARKKAANEAGIEAALDQVDPGWRARKSGEKAARSEKRSAERAVARATTSTRPEHSCTEAPTPTAADKAVPAGERTLVRLQTSWCEALARAGKTPATVAGYKAAITTAINHFGEGTLVASLTVRKIANFNDSDLVTKKRSGKPAAKAGVEKTRRALRLALAWAAAAGWIDAAPVPSKPEKTEAA